VFKTSSGGIDTLPSESLSGSLYVSLPHVAQKLGYQWTWDRFAEKLACVNASARLIFTQDVNFLIVNDSAYQLAAAPLRLGASLYLPAALAAEVFSEYGGSPVRWEPDSSTMVFSPQPATAKPSSPDTAGSGPLEGWAVPPKPRRSAVVKTEAKPRADSSLARAPSAPASAPKTGAGMGIQKVRTVVIDPGHGGRDPGAIGPDGVQEKDVTLAIALQLRTILKHNGDLVVYLTRESDVFVPLKERTEFANEKKADIFISIHANSIAGNAKKREQAQGFKVYFLSQAKNEEDKLVAMKENSVIELEDRTGKGDNLKNILTDMAGNEYLSESQDMSIMIAEAIGSQVADIPRLQQGVGQAPFWVLNGAFMPSVLIETAFISNPGEEKLLVNPKVQKRISLAVQSALSRFKTRYEEER
jgi:N-acetylmuramoyl-L-alanine amidase